MRTAQLCLVPSGNDVTARRLPVRHISFLLAGLLLIASCSLYPVGPTPTPTSTPLPADIATQAGERMLSVNSLHFVIELSGKLTYLDDPPTLVLKRAEGDVERPDHVRAIVKLSSFGVTSEVGIIGIGTEQYVTNPINQRWERIPAGQGWYFDPAILFDPEYGIETILKSSDWMLGSGEDTGEESQAHYYILHGRLPGKRLWLLTSGLIMSGEVIVDIWVSQEDSYVHRIYIVEPDSDPENPAQWLIEFSAFDEPVNIEAPPTP